MTMFAGIVSSEKWRQDGEEGVLCPVMFHPSAPSHDFEYTRKAIEESFGRTIEVDDMFAL